MYPLKLYLRHPFTATLLVLNGIVNLVIWLWLIVQISPQDQPIFLHYTVLFGVDAVGEWYRVFDLAIAGLVIFLVNACIGWFTFAEEKFIAHFLQSTALIAQLFIFVAATLIVALNV